MTDLREQLQQALGETYTLERELPRAPRAPSSSRPNQIPTGFERR